MVTRHHGRRENHDPSQHRPFAHAGQETVFAQRLHRYGEHRQTVAKGVGHRHAKRLQRAHHRKAAQGRSSVRAARAVDHAADTDAQQRDGENQSERKGRAAEQRTQHSVPDQFEEEEDESDQGGGDPDEFRRSRQGNFGATLGQRREMKFRGFRCVRTAAREEAGEQAHCEIKCAGQPEREAVAEVFQHPKRRQHGAGDRAEGIRGVEPGHATAGSVAPVADRAHCGGQGAAHEKGRSSQDDRGQYQAQHSAHDHAQAEGAAEREIEFTGDHQQEGCHGGAQGDDPLESSVGAEWIRPAVRLASQKIATQPHAAHEHGADRRGGRRGGAKDQTELAQPYGLVNQRA